MTRSLRRFEILLPLKFNNGDPVPNKLIGKSLLELRKRFGAVSSESQIIQGTWSHLGEVYRDELVRVFVDVEDSEQTRKFFTTFKEERFQQLDIWIASYPIDVF